MPAASPAPFPPTHPYVTTVVDVRMDEKGTERVHVATTSAAITVNPGSVLVVMGMDWVAPPIPAPSAPPRTINPAQAMLSAPHAL